MLFQSTVLFFAISLFVQFFLCVCIEDNPLLLHMTRTCVVLDKGRGMSWKWWWALAWWLQGYFVFHLEMITRGELLGWIAAFILALTFEDEPVSPWLAGNHFKIENIQKALKDSPFYFPFSFYIRFTSLPQSLIIITLSFLSLSRSSLMQTWKWCLPTLGAKCESLNIDSVVASDPRWGTVQNSNSISFEVPIFIHPMIDKVKYVRYT